MRNTRRLTTDESELLEQMLHEGRPVSEIVAALKCSPATVTTRRRKLGITTRTSDVSPELLAEARRLYEDEGLTFHAIMKRTGVAHGTLTKHADEQGWERKASPSGRSDHSAPDNLLEIWESLPNKTAVALGEALGIPWHAAYKIVVANDLPGRKTNKSSLAPYAEEIRGWYSIEGLTDSMIADRLGDEHGLNISENGVWSYRVHTLKLASDRSGRKEGRFSVAYRLSLIPDDELRRAFEETEQGFSTGRHAHAIRRTKSAGRLAQKYGVSHSAMYDELKRRGLLAGRFSFAGDGVTIYDLFQAGRSIPAIAKKLGCSQEFVRECLTKMGADLSNAHARMSPEERRAWRIAIRRGRAASEKEMGRYVHQRTGIKMDSTYETRFADYCDQYGLEWERFKRSEESLLPVNLGGDLDTFYGPDFWVSYGDERVLVEVKGIYGYIDSVKVTAWRAERGELALMTADELSDFFVAATPQEAFDVVKASIGCNPPVRAIGSSKEALQAEGYVAPDDLLQIWQALPDKTETSLAKALGISQQTAFKVISAYRLRDTDEPPF
jgi:hypothetical protein